MIELLVSPTGQPVDEATMRLIEAELHRLGVKTLGGYTLPLEPDHAARLLAQAVRGLAEKASPEQSEAARAIFLSHTGSGADQESDSFSDLLRDLGGPGSGRYPKGSGQNPSTVSVVTKVDALNEAHSLYAKITGNPKSNLIKDLQRAFPSSQDHHQRIMVDAYGDEISIDIIGKDADARIVHKTQLLLTPDWKGDASIEIPTMTVQEHARSTNVAIETLRGIHRLAEKSDAKSIILVAGSTHGGYAWAKIGATTTDPASLAEDVSDALIWSKTTGRPMMDIHERTILNRILKENTTNEKLPWLLASYRTSDGKLMGPRLLRGRVWEGRFDMKDPEARERFNRIVYRENR